MVWTEHWVFALHLYLASAFLIGIWSMGKYSVFSLIKMNMQFSLCLAQSKNVGNVNFLSFPKMPSNS